MAETISAIKVSETLLREIDDAAVETSMSREELLRASIRTFLDQERRWREVQNEVSERAMVLGLTDEDAIEEFLDSIDDQIA